MNKNTCECGIPWEDPCQCPEKVLEAFTMHHGFHIFYIQDFSKWFLNIYGDNNSELFNNVLNLDGVIELGTDAFQSPYEI